MNGNQINLGSLMVMLGLNTQGLERGVATAGSQFGLLGKKANLLAGGAIAGLIAAVTGLGIAATAMAEKFAVAMSEVATLVDTTKVSMQKFAKEVLEMSKRIPQSAVQLTKGLYQVISAGTDAADATGVLEDAARLATVGFTETEIAVDGLTTVLNAYGLEASESGRISDEMFETVRLGKLRFSELAESIGTVAPFAAQLEVATSDLMGAMATLTAGGLNAAESSTALRAVMSTLLKPTKEAKDKAKELGIEYSAAALRSKGLWGYLKYLQETLGDNQEALAELFPNVRALVGVLALAGKQSEQFEASTQKITDAQGSVSTAMQEVNQTLSHQWQILKNRLGVEMAKMGQQHLPGLASAVRWVADRFISETDRMIQRLDEIREKQKGAKGWFRKQLDDALDKTIDEMRSDAEKFMEDAITSFARGAQFRKAASDMGTPLFEPGEPIPQEHMRGAALRATGEDYVDDARAAQAEFEKLVRELATAAPAVAAKLVASYEEAFGEVPARALKEHVVKAMEDTEEKALQLKATLERLGEALKEDIAKPDMWNPLEGLAVPGPTGDPSRFAQEQEQWAALMRDIWSTEHKEMLLDMGQDWVKYMEEAHGVNTATVGAFIEMWIKMGDEEKAQLAASIQAHKDANDKKLKDDEDAEKKRLKAETAERVRHIELILAADTRGATHGLNVLGGAVKELERMALEGHDALQNYFVNAMDSVIAKARELAAAKKEVTGTAIAEAAGWGVLLSGVQNMLSVVGSVLGKTESAEEQRARAAERSTRALEAIAEHMGALPKSGQLEEVQKLTDLYTKIRKQYELVAGMGEGDIPSTRQEYRDARAELERLNKAIKDLTGLDYVAERVVGAGDSVAEALDTMVGEMTSAAYAMGSFGEAFQRWRTEIDLFDITDPIEQYAALNKILEPLGIQLPALEDFDEWLKGFWGAITRGYPEHAVSEPLASQYDEQVEPGAYASDRAAYEQYLADKAIWEILLAAGLTMDEITEMLGAAEGLVDEALGAGGGAGDEGSVAYRATVGITEVQANIIAGTLETIRLNTDPIPYIDEAVQEMREMMRMRSLSGGETVIVPPATGSDIEEEMSAKGIGARR